MTAQDEQWREQKPLTSYLIRKVCDTAKGRTEEECHRNFPRDKYFIGSLRPVVPNDGLPVEGESDSEEDGNVHVASKFLRELRMKLAPVAFGADFQLANITTEVKIEVSLTWNCYYRVFPNRKEQIDYQMWVCDLTRPESVPYQARSENQDVDVEAMNAQSDGAHSRRRGRRPTEDLCPKFRKIECRTTGIVSASHSDSGLWQFDDSSFIAEVEAECLRAKEVVLSAQDAVKTGTDLNERIGVPEDALRDDETYASFLEGLGTPIAPKWGWGFEINLRPGYDKNRWIVVLRFTNSSAIDADARNQEGYFFDTHAAFKIIGTSVVPFELGAIPHGFRFDRTIFARGFNCAVEPEEGQSVKFVTNHVPVYDQHRYSTRMTPPAPFERLASDPIPILQSVLIAMDEYLEVWHETRHRYVQNDPTWEDLHGQEYDADLQLFESEIRRFSEGFRLIEEDPDIMKAFRLTNETFSRGDKTSWRLFQLVFIVSQIPSMAALRQPDSELVNERNFVDIIYFPTGGGKTEAYLGVAVFHMFFDRLRGKRGGVTAWTRFPLRLLTLQQTQRAADVVGLAELVRLEQNDERLTGQDIDGFSIGYFVGEGGSPNKIVRPHPDYATASERLVWSQVNTPDERQIWKRVVRCPACETQSITVEFDPDEIRLLHRCTNRDCRFPNGRLPVYIVDNEIYRYLPSLILGTIDKLAVLGNQRKLSMVFGAVDGRCPKHGYFMGVCCQTGCSHRKDWDHTPPERVTGVTLFIQDELHLLKEGLGTFDSHYETFSQRLRKEYGHQEPLKVIASSATIEAFERQVEHLYGRQRQYARRFPGLGPTNQASFYAETQDYPQRLFVGIVPHNKTILNAVLELIEYYHRELMFLERVSTGSNPYGGQLIPGSEAYLRLLDNYKTSLSYFLANRQLDQIHTDIDGDVNGNLIRDGFSALNVRELTGNSTTEEVARTLAHLEQPSISSNLPDCVLATSMVSHGVDVDRLNMMLFFGMPRLNGEYIQASSRVGRKHIGIVFDFFNPIRERDQSHYAYFSKFHQFLGQLVEPAAINRWSRFSIERTAPGLFLAVLLQVLANRQTHGKPSDFYNLQFVIQKIASGDLSNADFVPFLKEAYNVLDSAEPGARVFSDEIERLVQVFLFDEMSAPGSAGKSIFDVLDPPPLRSLRDVDEPVPITLDFTGSEWARRSQN